MSFWVFVGVVATVILFASVVLNIILARFSYRMGNIMINVEDAMNESMDQLDVHYASLSKILEKPVFFDSIEIRQAIDDISKSRDAILYVANTLAESIDPKSVEEDSDGNEG
jgi:hypothetical protein